ncbi:unnamed protein product [Diamesa hyperborea]
MYYYLRNVYQLMLLCIIVTSAIGTLEKGCEIESWEFVRATNVCPCIASKYKSIKGELETIKEKLSYNEKDLELANDKLKVFYEEFLIFNCEINDDDPQLCVVQNLEVEENNMKVIKALVPESSFTAVKDLTELEILNSNTKFIPKDIFDVMPSLVGLTISESSLKSITRGSFKGANTIESITISHNIISELGPHIFEGAETVLHLFLPENGINTVSPDAFTGLKRLKVLSLRGNNLKELDAHLLKDNISLRKLTFSQNRIHKISDDLLKNNRELIYLKFDHNALPRGYDHKNLTQYAKKELISDFGRYEEDDDEEKS